MTTYSYKQQFGLNSVELFFWISVDKTLEQLGVEDLGAAFAILAGQPIASTRAKVGGAIKGASIASIASRRLLHHDLKVRLPMLTGSSLGALRIALTRNLGAFVGRTVPVVDWVIDSTDVARINWNTVTAYNAIVSSEDRILP